MKKNRHEYILIRHNSGSIQEFPIPSNKKIAFYLRNVGTSKINWVVVLKICDPDKTLGEDKTTASWYLIHLGEDQDLGELILNRTFKMFANGEFIFDFYEGPLSKHARNYEDAKDSTGLNSLFSSIIDEVNGD